MIHKANNHIITSLDNDELHIPPQSTNISEIIKDEHIRAKKTEIEGSLRQIQNRNGAMINKKQIQTKKELLNKNLDIIKANGASERLSLLKTNSGIIRDIEYYERKSQSIIKSATENEVKKVHDAK